MKIVLKHAGKWLYFQNPERVLRAERIEEVLPMLREAEASGLFVAGFVSYEASPAFDHALKTHPADGFPLLCLGLFHAPDVLEQIEMNVPMTEKQDGGRRSVGALYTGPDQKRGPDGASLFNAPTAYSIGKFSSSVSKDEFVATIAQIKARIAEGATYQVNYTYRLNADFSGDAWAFFYDLVNGQKTDYAAFIDTGDFAICSASPELFFNLNAGTILSRPMKGTARRGRTFAEDWKQAEALRNSEKDCAENIMIVDMIRNDIGRIATPGSVETVSRFDVEKYPTVWQMTSTVQGKSDEDVASTIKALFPCASITGAPKAKTMEIIQGLEKSPRKIYTGGIGFMTPQGEACFSVAIRTALIDRAASRLEYGVGGGIVWDSEAGSEYEETLTKARVLTQPRPDFQLLETMLWEPESGVFLLNEHLQRLGKSAAYFDVPLDAYAVFQGLEKKLQTLEKTPHRLRLLVSRGGSFEVQAIPQKSDGDVASTIMLAKEPVDSQDVFLFHKTTHRAVYEKAKADFPDCDDVILWNEKGEVTEGCVANLVIRKNGRLVTPPVECGLLAGTFRKHLLKEGEIIEQAISVDDLKAADEIFLINSVRKWRKAIL
jgi:para-aminobenzoate synthetase/4-amino-4-deoxychorismate lyase